MYVRLSKRYAWKGAGMWSNLGLPSDVYGRGKGREGEGSKISGKGRKVEERSGGAGSRSLQGSCKRRLKMQYPKIGETVCLYALRKHISYFYMHIWVTVWL